MKRSFSEYCKDMKNINEGLGSSFASMELPVSQAMANLLSLIRGAGNRARALNWMITEGLQQASQGREKLFQLVVAKLQNQPTIQFGRRANTPSSAAVVGEMAQQPFLYHGDDPEELSSLDLFSTDARMRFPELMEIDLDGLSIDEYYAKHFEPKYMVVSAGAARGYKRLNIQKMNAILAEKGLDTFRYGGPDGYLQYVEKGNWLPPKKRKKGSPNLQFGPDLRPDDSAPSFDRSDRGNYLYRFVGGSTRSAGDDPKLLAQLVGGLEFKLHQMVQRWDKTPPEDPSQKSLYDAIKQGKLKRHELAAKEGKKDHTKKLFGVSFERSDEMMAVNHPNYPNPEEDAERFEREYNPVTMFPPDTDFEELKDVVWEGMDHQTEKPVSRSTWKNPDGFGPQWNPKDPNQPKPPDGYWIDTGNDTFVFKLNKKQQENIFLRIFGRLDDQGIVTVRGRWSDVAPETQPGNNNRWLASNFINVAVDNNPELQEKVKSTLYNFGPDFADPKNYTTDQTYFEKEVNPIPPKGYEDHPINPHDDFLTKLWDSGYRWMLSPAEKKTGKPNWQNDRAVLALGPDRLTIIRRQTPGTIPPEWKYFALIPNDEEGPAYSPPHHGLSGSSWLAGGGVVRGAINTGDIDMDPVHHAAYQSTIDDLKQGSYGEPVKEPVSSELELPSIKHAIHSARKRFDARSYTNASQVWENEQLAQWALEGLWSRMGDPVTKWGFLTEKDYELLNWNPEDNLGIFALLKKQGVEDPEKQSEIVQNLIDVAHNGGSWINFLELGYPDNVNNAVKRNAYLARVRIMSQHVLRMMNQDSVVQKDASGKKLVSSGRMEQGKEEGGRAQSYADFGRTLAGLRSDVGEVGGKEDWKRLGWNSIRQLAGVGGEKADIVPELLGSRQQPVRIRRKKPEPETPVDTKPTIPPENTPTQMTGPQPEPEYDPKYVDTSAIYDPKHVDTSLIADIAPGNQQQPAYDPKHIDTSLFADHNLVDTSLIAEKARMPGYLFWQDCRTYLDPGLINWGEMVGTGAVYDDTKPKDGCGFNWWGAAGNPGVSISGEVKTVKSDPDGTKGKRGRKRK